MPYYYKLIMIQFVSLVY